MTPERDKHSSGAGWVAPWMRAVSFAGLHRILKAVSDSPDGGLRAGQINAMVRNHEISLASRLTEPAPTTLYHYRNTLIRLRALVRDGKVLRTNDEDPDVRVLLQIPAPRSGVDSLGDTAKNHFAALVLRNEVCRSMFFDLFMPKDTPSGSVSGFRSSGMPVTWVREGTPRTGGIVLENTQTGASMRYDTPVQVAAIPYGVRYWARDELELVDEYCQRSPPKPKMFPVRRLAASERGQQLAVVDTVRQILSWRTLDEWTVFSVFDLISRCCERRRQPRRILFNAIGWLTRHWPHHTVVMGTSRSLATLPSTSPGMESIMLRNYYRASDGSHVSHIRIHRSIQAPQRSWRPS